MYSHYYRNTEHLSYIDIYRIIDLYQVNRPCLQHALKKIICAGERGSKDFETDVCEAIRSLNRALQMVAEDCNKVKGDSFFGAEIDKLVDEADCNQKREGD